MIADFAGMQPLRDPVLLPDNNAQYADNCWLYRGQVRGFRADHFVYDVIYSDTQSVYRIPIDPNAPPDFTTAGSYWLEFPDPYMSVIRNPTVGDVYNRYYFFPSDQYASAGVNPAWPVTPPPPVFNTLSGIIAGTPPFTLGVPAPTGGPPTVTPPLMQAIVSTNAATAPGGDALHFASASTIRKGMLASDVTDIRITAAPTAVATAGTNYLTFSSTGSGAGAIVVGMSVRNTYNPGSIFAGSLVSGVGPTSVAIDTLFTADIQIGEVIQFDNANAIPSGTTVKSVDSGTQITLENKVVNAGVYSGDVIQFDTDVAETRAYVYTYVTSYAEEGQTSPATVATGDIAPEPNVTVVPTAGGISTSSPYIALAYDPGTIFPGMNIFNITTNTHVGTVSYISGTTLVLTTNATSNGSTGDSLHFHIAGSQWVITIPPPPSIDVTGNNITHCRLYRTVVDSAGNATYYQVVEAPLNFSGVTTIIDDAPPSGIVANKQLDSIGYSPPPAGLQGVVMMANGIAAGFTNEREVWFSAAYLPHAWPAAYALTVDYPIVGLTANGTSLNILTQGSPFIATGVTPDTMTIGKITANEPCISRGSIVSSGEGAYYASPNGIQLLNTGGTTNITLNIYEKEFHYTLLPPKWAAGRYGSTYVSFIKGTPADGDHGGFAIDRFEEGANQLFSYIHFPVNVLNIYSDELSGQLFSLMQDGTVMQWNPPVGIPDVTTLRSWEWKTKQFRFTTPQQFKAFMVLFEVPPEITITLGPRNTDQGQVFDPASQYLLVRIYADGRPVVVREVQKSGEVLLIPGGFKAEMWEFMFVGQIGLKFFKVASSVKELKAA
jgi:hypothetical protein